MKVSIRATIAQTAGLIVLSCFSATASAAAFSQFVVFGDSLSDNGNLFRMNGGIWPLTPPNYAGRFANGPVWPELMHVDLGITMDNRAVGGATSGFLNTNSVPQDAVFPAPGAFPGLQQQVGGYLNEMGGVVDAWALYSVAAGANDLRRFRPFRIRGVQ